MKGIFIYNHPDCYSEEEYKAYLKRILKIKESEESDLSAAHSSQSIRKRQINILNQFILNAVKMQKLVVIGLQGCVVTPFFGASLGGDLRFASENMYFSLAHLTFGLHPTGALPYLLPRFTGINRAKDFLFRGGNISAEQALKLGLINQIFPQATFWEDCREELKKLQRIDPHLIKITKQLMNIYADELERYFEFESKISFF
jgi:2-(1,2-epoxy-1,2-dihydrophenyl)acetyl-CoA isomerase